MYMYVGPAGPSTNTTLASLSSKPLMAALREVGPIRPHVPPAGWVAPVAPTSAPASGTRRRCPSVPQHGASRLAGSRQCVIAIARRICHVAMATAGLMEMQPRGSEGRFTSPPWPRGVKRGQLALHPTPALKYPRYLRCRLYVDTSCQTEVDAPSSPSSLAALPPLSSGAPAFASAPAS
jgi:hypothetical protein